MRIAVFDLDKTITQRGTWGRFVSLSVRRKPWRLIGLWVKAALGQLSYKFERQERIAVKRGMLRWSLSGQSREKLTTLAERFAMDEIASGLRPGALREIEARRAAGDTLIMATAAADLVANPIAARLGITHVVSTHLAWEGDVCARHFGSENCYGPGKLDQLQKYLATFPDYDRATAHITMYSDSYADWPALEFADRGVAVHPDARLRAAADLHDLEIVDWSNDEEI